MKKKHGEKGRKKEGKREKKDIMGKQEGKSRKEKVETNKSKSKIKKEKEREGKRRKEKEREKGMIREAAKRRKGRG